MRTYAQVPLGIMNVAKRLTDQEKDALRELFRESPESMIALSESIKVRKPHSRRYRRRS